MELIAVMVGLLAAAMVAGGVAMVAYGRQRGSWVRDCLRRRLLVQTRDGQTLDGQLVRIDRDGLVLGPVRLEGGHDLGGQVWIDRDRVAWLQQPDGGES